MGRSRELALRIQHERELREAAEASFDHERELRTLFDQHERELREKSEHAVEKARDIQVRDLERRLEGMNEFRAQLTAQSNTFLTIDRFERDHSLLTGRLERSLQDIHDKLELEQRVTVRQDATEQLLAALASSRRWLIGLGVTVAIFGITVLLHSFGIL